MEYREWGGGRGRGRRYVGGGVDTGYIDGESFVRYDKGGSNLPSPKNSFKREGEPKLAFTRKS